MARETPAQHGKFSIIVLQCQIMFIILFAFFAEYDFGSDARHDYELDSPAHEAGFMRDHPHGVTRLNKNNIAMFMDVHTMVFIGFGFLMVFLKRYGYSSLGFNLLTAAFAVQWAILVEGFFTMYDTGINVIHINIETLFKADFAAVTVLISFGAVLGRLSHLQMLVMAMFEITLFSINKWLADSILKTVDVGSTVVVHVFGAYFGIFLGAVMQTHGRLEEGQITRKKEASYFSDLFAMIGSVFLWVFWPSFNAAFATGNAQQRAVINTYLALTASTVITFAISVMVHPKDRVHMSHIQNATLAGGVAVGTASNMMINPWGALSVGAFAGFISVLGYKFLTPFLGKKMKLKDTCGVNNLHGMPGIIGGVVGVAVTTFATEDLYGSSLYKIFPGMAPNNVTLLEPLQAKYGVNIEMGLGRTARNQAGWQLVELGITLFISIFGGMLTGLVLRIPIWNRPSGEDIYEDTPFWNVEEGQPENISYQESALGLPPSAKQAIERFDRSTHPGEATVKMSQIQEEHSPPASDYGMDNYGMEAEHDITSKV